MSAARCKEAASRVKGETFRDIEVWGPCDGKYGMSKWYLELGKWAEAPTDSNGEEQAPWRRRIVAEPVGFIESRESKGASSINGSWKAAVIVSVAIEYFIWQRRSDNVRLIDEMVHVLDYYLVEHSLAPTFI
jgi:hypothetical protein